MTVHPKTAAGGLASAATVLVLGVLDRLGVSASPVEASALTTVLAFAASYLKGA